MKILVTGSEGFIGKNLVTALKSQGHEVIGWDIKLGSGVEDAGEHWRNLPKDIDTIYHLGCVNQMSALSQPYRNLTSNSLACKFISGAAKRMGARFIYTSTASVYGNALEIPTPVTAREAPITDYAVAKLAGEHFVRNSGANWTILRLSNVYGPHQTLDNPYCGVIGRFITQSLAGEPMTIIGDGTQTRDFSYVDDVVEHLIFSAPRPWASERTLNVSSGQETSVSRLAKKISVETGGGYGTGTERRPIDGVQRRLLVPDLVCETELGVGIARTVDWFRSTGV